MPDPAPEQIAKLPQWAQQYINKLEGERQQAVRALRRHEDGQTESGTWFDDLLSIGEGRGEGGRGPSHHRFYVQSDRIGFSVAKNAHGDPVELNVFHDREEKFVEIAMPRDFCHIEAYGPGTIRIHHSPFNPFKERDEKAKSKSRRR